MLAALNLLAGTGAVNPKRDLAAFPKTDLAFWITSDARLDTDNGRVVQWNDIGEAENHAKQNIDEKKPSYEQSESEGEIVVFKGDTYLSSQPVVLFPEANSALTAFVTFKHFASPDKDKMKSSTLINYGASGMKLMNSNFEVGIKYKGDGAMFFVHRGSGRMVLSSKVKLAPDKDYHTLTVKVLSEATDAGSVIFYLDGKQLKSSDKNKGWLKPGKYPAKLSAPIDVGARIDGNTHAGTIMGHMNGNAEDGFTGVISEVVVYTKAFAEEDQKRMEEMLKAAQVERTSEECVKMRTSAGGGFVDPEADAAEDAAAKEEEANGSDDSSKWDYVTCMSSIKLRHKVLNVRLHSADIGYGSGSQQQAVTGNADAGDPGSYWQVRPTAADEAAGKCKQGELLEHGSKIRLLHLTTKKNLHSHAQFQSPLSQKQEVSCFGDGGNGDAGDEWEVMVRESGDAYGAGWGGPWLRESMVRFKHVVTGQYLFSHRKQFTNGPVEGMSEVACVGRADDRTLWSVDEGIFHPKNAEV